MVQIQLLDALFQSAAFYRRFMPARVMLALQAQRQMRLHPLRFA
jgi:hypothetical protein